MTINQTSLLLDQTAWDLVLDINGNIALGSSPYSIAQDVASATRTFLGECWYNTNLGIPYWQQILGEMPPMSYIKQQIIEQSLTIPNVVSSQVTFQSFENRQLSGQIQVIDTDGAINNLAFGISIHFFSSLIFLSLFFCISLNSSLNLSMFFRYR